MRFGGSKKGKVFTRAFSNRTVPLVIAALLIGAGGYYFLQQSSAAPDTESLGTGGSVIEGKAPAINNDTASERTKAALGQGMSAQTGLHNASKKEIAMRLVSSAENSSLDWRAQFKYIEDIGDGRGYTAGIIGFCSGTGDMLDLVKHYTQLNPSNVLAQYLPALHKVNGTDSHDGLGTPFERDWRTAAADPLFRQAQESERDRVYFDPAVNQAKADGLSTLGQFIYYDAAVMHGPDAWGGGLPNIRERAMITAKTPAQGGDETAYLNAFLDKRKQEMLKEAAHHDTGRVDTEQRKFLQARNFNLDAPLNWSVYGDNYSISTNP